jgi:hypothetical protein
MEQVYNARELDAAESLMYLRDLQFRWSLHGRGVHLRFTVTRENVDYIRNDVDVLNEDNVISVRLDVRSGLERLDVLGKYNHKLVEVSVDASVTAISGETLALQNLIGPRLRTLRCPGSVFGDLRGLTLPIGTLTTLHVSNARLTSLKTVVGQLVNLTDLDVSRNNITNFAPLANLRNLRTLNVSGCPIRSLNDLSRLVELQTLDVSETSISQLGPLSNLQKLEILFINQTNVGTNVPRNARNPHNSTSILPLHNCAGLRVVFVTTGLARAMREEYEYAFNGDCPNFDLLEFA